MGNYVPPDAAARRCQNAQQHQQAVQFVQEQTRLIQRFQQCESHRAGGGWGQSNSCFEKSLSSQLNFNRRLEGRPRRSRALPGKNSPLLGGERASHQRIAVVERHLARRYLTELMCNAIVDLESRYQKTQQLLPALFSKVDGLNRYFVQVI